MTASVEKSLEQGEFCLGMTRSGDMVSLESLELELDCKVFEAIRLTELVDESLELEEFCLGVTGPGDIVSLESLELELIEAPRGIMSEWSES